MLHTSRPTKLVVVDFSGTLSLEAALFASKENLSHELKQAGLWQLGLNQPEMFWDEIINPTWQEGSTTLKGYQHTLFERLCRVSASWLNRPAEAALRAGVARLAERYFARSLIDRQWRRFMQDLLTQPDVMLVIATDHYAETTGHILHQLSTLGLQGKPTLQARGASKVHVANSADLGYHKDTAPFWETLKWVHDLTQINKIVVLDDFGFNEDIYDDYADQGRVGERLQRIVNLLSAVFGAQTSVFTFFLRDENGGLLMDDIHLRQEYHYLIRQAGKFTRRVLADPPNAAPDLAYRQPASKPIYQPASVAAD